MADGLKKDHTLVTWYDENLRKFIYVTVKESIKLAAKESDMLMFDDSEKLDKDALNTLKSLRFQKFQVSSKFVTYKRENEVSKM